MVADLHLHTLFSDGTFSPEEVVAHAKAKNLRAIALTDHDTLEGCVRAKLACEQAGIQFVSGVELTAEQDGTELHILGYFVELENARFLGELARFQTVRQERVREMVARLNRIQVPLQAEAVFALANCRSPGRPHVARALVQTGLCASLDEAFERFLKKNRPAWVPKFKMSVSDAIQMIHRAGGVAVVAHPVLNHADSFLPRLAAAGLDGLECFHTKHSPSCSRHYLDLARQHNLLVSGGSDCHGLNKGKPLIGSVTIPMDLVEKLAARSSEIRAQR